MSNFDFMQTPPEQENPAMAVPGEPELLGHIRSLYALIERQREELDNQRSLLRRMSAELMLEGRWKPLEQAAQILGFPHGNYAVCLYNFAPGSGLVNSEDKSVFDLKLRISDCFESAFSPVCECCSCESKGSLGAVLLNIPATGVSDRSLLEMLKVAVEDINDRWGAMTAASLSCQCGDIANLPDARQDALELVRLQLTLPGASTALCSGELELFDQTPEGGDLEELARRQDLDGLGRALYGRFMGTFRHSGIQAAALALMAELDDVKKALGLGRQYEDISISAGERLRHVSYVGQAIGILFEYIDQLRPALAESPLTGAPSALELPARIRQIVDRDFALPELSLSYIGSQLGVGENKVTKSFKKAYGIGVLSYIHHLRIAKAKELLLSTSSPVSEIYALSGYTNRRTFDRVFKQYTGVTTARFRAENKGA